MNVKYFQPVADIKNHYDDIVANFEKPKFGLDLLKTWGISPEDKADILQEREVLRYLIGCKFRFVSDTNVKKPSIAVVNRCFNRHLLFLERIHLCHADNVNKHPSKIIQKQYNACREYLFKFSQSGWFEKLPNEILTFENKYPELYEKKV